MASKPELMRDRFIEVLCDAARADPNFYFISADLGAAALDAFRRDYPRQFIHPGICEQNMVDLAAGLALSGKQVFLYAMAPFITARCYEQIKCVLASMRLPVTLIAVGVGFGYDHATLTHFTPEDVACMKAMTGIEVWTPSDAESAASLAHLAVMHPAFRYIRLERVAQPAIYDGTFAKTLPSGLAHIAQGRDVCIVAAGYMVHTALAVRELLAAKGIEAGVVDLFRVKPMPVDALVGILRKYHSVLTLEEQMLEGGFGGAVAEAMVDTDTRLPMRRLGLKDGFVVVNGHREQLHRAYGLDAASVVEAAVRLTEKSRAA